MVEFEEIPETESGDLHVNMSIQLKDRGNELFKQKRYKEALKAYKNSLSVSSITDTEMRCALYGNLASTLFKLGDFKDALEACREAKTLNPDLIKLYAREATILGCLHNYEEAIKVLIHAIRKFPDADEKPSLQRALSNLKKRQEKWKTGPNAAKNMANQNEKKPKGGFLNRTSGKSIYDDKPCAPKNETDAQQLAAKRLLDKLRKSFGTNDEDLKEMTLVDGLFKRLMNPVEFQRIVYQGAKIPTDQKFLPRTFEELVNNDLYANALVGLFPKIRKRAHVVLENVKRKGALEGDIMDERTEAILRPQVLNEAFAHEIVTMMKQINRRQNAFLAQAKEFIADPDAEQALGDQLDSLVVKDLLDDKKCFAIQENFLDDEEGEWQTILEQEVNDVIQAGKLSNNATTHNISKEEDNVFTCWLNKRECDEKHPAISYLIEQLECLPYELNRKSREFNDNREPLNLCKLSDSHIMLMVIAPESHLFPTETPMLLSEELIVKGYTKRLDGSSGENDNGLKLSATYHFNRDWDSSKGGRMCLYLSRHQHTSSDEKSDSSRIYVDPKADTLVLYRSRQVFNSVENTRYEKSEIPKRRMSITVFYNGAEVDSW